MTAVEMPWLLRPTPEAIADLKSITGAGGTADLRRLGKIANFAWNEIELGAIGRKIRNIESKAGPDTRSELTVGGLTYFSLLVISSNTFGHITDALRATALRAGILLDCRVVEYEEPETWLAVNEAALATSPPSATLLALDRKALHLQCAIGDAAASRACVDAAIARVGRSAAHIAKATKAPVILQTLAADAGDPQSSMDGWLDGSPRGLLLEYNRALIDFARRNSFMVFDAAAIADLVGHANWSAGRYWYVAKLPFAPACIPLYSHRLLQLVCAMLGKSRRVLILDLDNTLWGGVIGDDGVAGLTLGQGSGRGEAHLDIQRLALHYKQRGVALCVASKNTEDIALEGFRTHPEMLLKESDIALFRINWEDKASNINAISKTLELGLDTFVFLDDNPVERKLIRDVLPAVAVPELGADPATWLSTIQAAGYFEQVSFSSEDNARTEFYQANALRDTHSKAIGDHKKFLESLQMTMKVAPFDAVGRSRIAQLISKSNQFNLTTRRYAEKAVADMEAASDIETMQIRLSDVFGDNGMISVVICRKIDRAWEIDTWIMSCRVLGRGVEQAVLNLLAARARAGGAVELQGEYLPTAKNGIVRDHYEKLGFARVSESEGGATRWSLSLQDYRPEEVSIEISEIG